MRPLSVILLSVLLVVVSLYGGFTAGVWYMRIRADGLAHNTLRNLSFQLPMALMERGRDMREGKIDESQLYILPKLPLGVYALYDGDGSRPILSDPAVPVACISPGYDPHIFIVLFSNHSREKMTVTQLEELLGTGKYFTPYDLRGFRKRPHSEWQ